MIEHRKNLMKQDARGRTALHHAAQKGDQAEVEAIIFKFRGTGLSPPRLALITMEDVTGCTAADLAEQHGHDDIAHLLRGEQGRMEYFE